MLAASSARFNRFRRAACSGQGAVLHRAVECGLGQFHEPIAERIPGKFVQRLREQVETVVGVVRVGFCGDLVQTRQDPLLCFGARLRHAVETRAFGVHQHKARGIPQLVAEVLVAFGAAQVELDIAAMRGECGDGEAQRVGAVRDDAVREFLARGFFDLGRILGLHQPGGALGDQRLDADAVDDVERIGALPLDLDIFWPCASRIRPVI